MRDLNFMGPGHRDRFMFAVRQLNLHEATLDWRAALFLLTGVPALWSKARKYIDVAGYCWDEMLRKEDFSSGFKTLARLSVDLYNGDGGLAIEDLWSRLDDRNFELAIRAIRHRRGG